MNDAYTTIGDIERDMAARIAAVSTAGKPYQWADADAFRESRLPLTVRSDAALRSHLLFSVACESAPTGRARHSAGLECEVENAVFAVLILYRIPPAPASDEAQSAVYRYASDMALDVLGVLLADRVGSPPYGVEPSQVYRPVALVDGWLTVRIEMLCTFSLNLSPRVL